MVGAEEDTTTAAGNKAMEASKATAAAVVETGMVVAEVVEVNNKKTCTEESNIVNLRSIVGRMDVIVATMDLNSKAKMQATIRKQ